jgi:hypothetical protein
MTSMRALCAEFPNDNPDLHLGAIWVQEDPTSALAAETREIELADAVWMIGAPPPAEEECAPAIVAESESESESESASESASESESESRVPVESMIVLAAPDDDEPIVVEELDFDLSHVPLEGAPEDDAYATLVETLGAVAVAEGGEAAAVRGILEGSDVVTAAAWRAVLRGEVDDISTCGSAMLDEWAADVVARAVGAPGKAAQLRRELRARGVCAFGLIAA